MRPISQIGWTLALLMVACSGGCTKTPATAVTADALAAKAVGVPAEAAATAQATDASRLKLEKAAALVRCQLTGYAPPTDTVYADNGFASAAAFGQAWQDAAKADPKWAEQAVATLYRRPCPGQRALPAPAIAAPQTPSEAAP
ncbi:MAG: hypothetical protein EXR77_17770 [Myxococcales bacterium]|nr:hypothetical protein [Myxococcales bacterium]